MTRSLQMVLSISFVLLACVPAAAQEQRGAIEGVVRDTQGAAVPEVAVLARKAHVLCDFAFGTSVGLRWFGAHGIARTRQAGFIPGEAYPVFYQGRDSDGRLPFLSRLPGPAYNSAGHQAGFLTDEVVVPSRHRAH